MPVEIGCDDEQVAELVRLRYSRMRDSDHRAPALTAYIMARGRTPGVFIGDEFVRGTDAAGSTAGRNSAALTEAQAMLAINARIFRLRSELVVFHAAAVAIGDAAAVIVGPSGSGKSTTAISLLLGSHEHRPLSDEFALVNVATGMVESFPRLFSVRSGARKVLGLTSLTMQWEAVDPEGFLTHEWAQSARRSAFFFIVGRARSAHARPLPLSEGLFLAVGSEVQTTIDCNHIRVVDRVITALAGARLYALTLGAPEDNIELISRLTLKQAAVPA